MAMQHTPTLGSPCWAGAPGGTPISEDPDRRTPPSTAPRPTLRDVTVLGRRHVSGGIELSLERGSTNVVGATPPGVGDGRRGAARPTADEASRSRAGEPPISRTSTGPPEGADDTAPEPGRQAGLLVKEAAAGPSRHPATGRAARAAA